jgi:hypothetical protein
MDLVYNLFRDLANNKIFKKKIERSLDVAMENLDKAIEALKSDKAPKAIERIVEAVDKRAIEDYKSGKLSEKSVEDARKMALIFPSPLSDVIYEITKTYFAAGKSGAGDEKNQPKG